MANIYHTEIDLIGNAIDVAAITSWLHLNCGVTDRLSGNKQDEVGNSIECLGCDFKWGFPLHEFISLLYAHPKCDCKLRWCSEYCANDGGGWLHWDRELLVYYRFR